MDICRAMEISVFAGIYDAELAVGPVVGNSSCRAESWGFIRESGDRGVVGRLEDRLGSGRTAGEELEEEGEVVEG